MTTEERLAKVERELGRVKRRSRWLLVALALGLAALALVWALAEEVRAKRFVLVDEEGRERAALEMNADRPMLSLCDEKGQPRVALGVTADGPGPLESRSRFCAAALLLLVVVFHRRSSESSSSAKRLECQRSHERNLGIAKALKLSHSIGNP